MALRTKRTAASAGGSAERSDKSRSAFTLVVLNGPRACFLPRASSTMTMDHTSPTAIKTLPPTTDGSSPSIACGADHPPDNQTPDPVGRGDLIVPPHGPPL